MSACVVCAVCVSRVVCVVAVASVASEVSLVSVASVVSEVSVVSVASVVNEVIVANICHQVKTGTGLCLSPVCTHSCGENGQCVKPGVCICQVLLLCRYCQGVHTCMLVQP